MARLSHTHEDFILTSASKVLKDALYAMSILSPNIKTWPSKEYLLQALLLKLTGFQEQKLKCIRWELATDDYTYRYKHFSSTATIRFSEGSSLDDKNSVFKDLRTALLEMEGTDSYDMFITTLSQSAYDAARIELQLLKSSSIYQLIARQCNDFEDLFNAYLQPGCFCSGDKLLKDCSTCSKDPNKNTPGVIHCFLTIESLMRKTWELRNKCAHNATSYQSNIHTLKTMSARGYLYDNYVTSIVLMLWTDSIFTGMFNRYIELAKKAE